MIYWDSSALVETFLKPALKERLLAEGGHTRQHALSEVFSALTAGNLAIRVSPRDAAQAVRIMAGKVKFVHLTEEEILEALDGAQARGVRGGRVHDYLHAKAAEKIKATVLLTADRYDFSGLVPGLPIEVV